MWTNFVRLAWLIAGYSIGVSLKIPGLRRLVQPVAERFVRAETPDFAKITVQYGLVYNYLCQGQTVDAERSLDYLLEDAEDDQNQLSGGAFSDFGPLGVIKNAAKIYQSRNVALPDGVIQRLEGLMEEYLSGDPDVPSASSHAKILEITERIRREVVKEAQKRGELPGRGQ